MAEQEVKKVEAVTPVAPAPVTAPPPPVAAEKEKAATAAEESKALAVVESKFFLCFFIYFSGKLRETILNPCSFSLEIMI